MAIDSKDHPSNKNQGGLLGAAYDGVMVGAILGGMFVIIVSVIIYTCCVKCIKRRRQEARGADKARGLRLAGETRSEAGREASGGMDTLVRMDAQDNTAPGARQSLNVNVPLPLHRRTSGYSRRTDGDLQPLSHKMSTDTLTSTMDEVNIDERRLKLDEVIGMGTFSLVYNGRLMDKSHTEVKYQAVTVKTVHGPGCTPAVLKQFVLDGLRLRSVAHRHVLPLVGLVIRDDQPFVVLPHTDKGSLHTYISDLKQHFTVRTLIQMGLEVAEGLRYLSTQGFVHQDIATRNCMVHDDGRVVIGDCALSQDLFDEDYFTVEQLSHDPLPIGWMAVETLTQLNYSLQSDVWSLGVVLWELLTRGQAPYSDMEALTIIAYVRTGQRLERPSVAPANLYDLMVSCWREDPYCRPSIVAVCQTLTTILQGPTQ